MRLRLRIHPETARQLEPTHPQFSVRAGTLNSSIPVPARIRSPENPPRSRFVLETLVKQTLRRAPIRFARQLRRRPAKG